MTIAQKRKKRAFTLSEVLITLGIIGVVAAIVIPALMANQQKQQYVVGLKKFYSTFNEALKQMAVDAGCPEDLRCVFDSTDYNVVGLKFIPYFNVAKYCRTTPAESGCFQNKINMNLDYTGSWSGMDSTSYFRFMTTDGMTVHFGNSPYLNCGGTVGAVQNVCYSNVYVDVNGFKKPNTIGRDIFQFWILKNQGLYPLGGKDVYNWKTNGCTYGTGYGTSTNGAFCAGRIIEEGWEMTY